MDDQALVTAQVNAIRDLVRVITASDDTNERKRIANAIAAQLDGIDIYMLYEACNMINTAWCKIDYARSTKNT